MMRHLIALFIFSVGLSGFFDSEFRGVPWPVLAIITLVATAWAIRFSYFRADVREYFSCRTRHRSQSMIRS